MNHQLIYFSYLPKFRLRISSIGPNIRLKFSLSIDNTLNASYFQLSTVAITLAALD